MSIESRVFARLDRQRRCEYILRFEILDSPPAPEINGALTFGLNQLIVPERLIGSR